MSFFNILGTVFLGPLKLIFEVIFQIANDFIDHPGISIIVLSLVMNILVLPLYRRADAMQEEARDIENKLRRGVAHIKKSFSGDEKMMIMQTYYRQNHYKPTDALKGSLSLLLEIPFFMAAYQFLSHLEILNGASLGPIKDLSAPDGLIVIGSLSINLLPILMTAVNVISCVIYLKGFPLKSKIQLYGMAGFFLVFLYTSPAGLVFYWTLNNVFSLVKTIFYKLKNPKKVLSILTTLLGIAFIVFGGFIYNTDEIGKRITLIVIGVLLLLPLLLPILTSKLKANKKEVAYTPKKSIFVLGNLFLTVLLGLLIPANFIAASPQEYVNINYFHHPLWYIVSSFAMAAGFFLVWMSVFYWLANKKGKVIFERVIWILCGVTLVNYMFFGTNLGTISADLQYHEGFGYGSFSILEYIINSAVIIAVAAILYFLATKFKKSISIILLTAICAFGVMSAVHLVNIKKQVAEISNEQTSTVPNFNLNKNGQNVVVIMLDRGLGLYTPYIFNENPELQEQFAGFTYYSNVISHGGSTNMGAPAIFGGYEYTPVEMNKRNTETLQSKHNEALKVMPVLFSENGYDVTVCDPVYPDYQWNSNTEFFSEYPEIDCFITEGSFTDAKYYQKSIDGRHRNFFCFALTKSMPLFAQPAIYDSGKYNQIDSSKATQEYSVQTWENISTPKSTGIDLTFMNRYNVLSNLSSMTHITDSDQNTFMSMVNNLTHDPILLQEPDYVPAYNVDNTQYYSGDLSRFVIDGKSILMNNATRISHYETNMAAMQLLGDWFDYLRENGVYDNTKIIIVSDHGRHLNQSNDLIHPNGEDINKYFPLLLVKDFNSTEFTTSDEFMTNADVPALATEGLIENPVNPFTGKVISSDEKTAHDQYVTLSEQWSVNVNNGNTFLPSGWAKVKDNMWDMNNWEFYNKNIVLDEHEFPN